MNATMDTPMLFTRQPRPCRAARRRAIGMLYVDLGMVTRPQMNHALVECARTGLPLAETLKRLGYLA
jgi:hypothetical protein